MSDVISEVFLSYLLSFIYVCISTKITTINNIDWINENNVLILDF